MIIHANVSGNAFKTQLNQKMKFQKINILTILITLIMFLFAGCEGLSHADGIVISEETRMPIDSVQLIYKEDRHTITVFDTVYTDSSGHFQIANLVMCAPKCPNATLIFNKKGYITSSIYFDKQVLDTTLTIIMKPFKNWQI